MFAAQSAEQSYLRMQRGCSRRELIGDYMFLAYFFLAQGAAAGRCSEASGSEPAFTMQRS